MTTDTKAAVILAHLRLSVSDLAGAVDFSRPSAESGTPNGKASPWLSCATTRGFN